jgi:hypothetical protein
VLKNLNPDEVEKEHKRMRSGIGKLVMQFESLKMPKVGAVAKQIQSEVELFKKNLPIIRALTTDGFKERHIA